MAGHARHEELQKLLAAGGLAELEPGPRPKAFLRDQLEKPLEGLLAKAGLTSTGHELVLALILLWHDQMEAAHVIAQAVDNADGSYVHAILHRREPDYGNAKYWFHRVGAHPAFPLLAKNVETLPDDGPLKNLKSKLIPKGQWDAFAFVDLCEGASRKPANDPQTAALREIQRIEFEVLLEHLLAAHAAA